MLYVIERPIVGQGFIFNKPQSHRIAADIHSKTYTRHLMITFLTCIASALRLSPQYADGAACMTPSLLLDTVRSLRPTGFLRSPRWIGRRHSSMI